MMAPLSPARISTIPSSTREQNAPGRVSFSLSRSAAVERTSKTVWSQFAQTSIPAIPKTNTHPPGHPCELWRKLVFDAQRFARSATASESVSDPSQRNRDAVQVSFFKDGTVCWQKLDAIFATGSRPRRSGTAATGSVSYRHPCGRSPAGATNTSFVEHEKFLVHGIVSGKGVYQFVSSRPYRQRDGSSTQPLIGKLQAQWKESQNKGRALILGGRFEVISVDPAHLREPVAEGVRTKPGHEQFRCQLTVIDLQNISRGVSLIPLTEVELEFEDRCMKAPQIAQAYKILEEHQARCASPPRPVDGEPLSLPMITSPAGRGRAPTLIVYSEVVQRINDGLITNEPTLDAALFELIDAGRKARITADIRHPRKPDLTGFVHSDRQLKELRDACHHHLRGAMMSDSPWSSPQASKTQVDRRASGVQSSLRTREKPESRGTTVRDAGAVLQPETQSAQPGMPATRHKHSPGPANERTAPQNPRTTASPSAGPVEAMRIPGSGSRPKRPDNINATTGKKHDEVNLLSLLHETVHQCKLRMRAARQSGETTLQFPLHWLPRERVDDGTLQDKSRPIPQAAALAIATVARDACRSGSTPATVNFEHDVADKEFYEALIRQTADLADETAYQALLRPPLFAPSEATPPENLGDRDKIASFVQPVATIGNNSGIGITSLRVPLDKSLNGIAFAPAGGEFVGRDGWVGNGRQFVEPPTENIKAAGTVIVEEDGRVWVVEPTNHFAGLQHTFPKGRRGDPRLMDPRQTALKETLEETGLEVELVDYLTDAGTDGTTRYYLARRIGGTPLKAEWETQAVKLVPQKELFKLFEFNRSNRDTKVAEVLLTRLNQRTA